MRLIPDIRAGTQGYPEAVARRLRLVNITAWFAAALGVVFAGLRLIDPAPGMLRRGLINLGFAVGLGLVPLLHRLSPLAGPLVLVAIAYAGIFRTTYQVGTGGGAYLHYLTATALMVLLIGIEYPLLTGALAALAAGLTVTLHLVAPHSTGLLLPSSLFYGNLLTNIVATTAILFTVVFYAFRQLARAEARAEREYQRSETLLANILPRSVADRLKQKTATIADAYPGASILFVDMGGFTARSSDTSPADLVRFLDRVFTRLDGLVERRGLEKVKTTGDAYMVVSGVPDVRPDHAAALADLALDMREALAGLMDPKGREVPVRLGLASGPVVAGVVGTRKFFYDVWGDAVNTASRMESTGEPGRIQVPDHTYQELKARFDFEERGLIEVKGKGVMRTWFLTGRRSATTAGS
jgi:adenylate cyclase